MSSSKSLRDRIRCGEPLPAALDLSLRALTPIYSLGMKRRLARPRTRVDARVISYGNITAGGTGKTPAVIERAALEVAAGHRVAVLTRGYGSTPTKTPVVVGGEAMGEGIVQRIGDEPALILRRVPEVTIVKCVDRVAAARAAIEAGCDTLILDDGYQAVQLERDENIVVIDAANPFGSGYLLPRGVLREPLEQLARATHVLLTRCDQVDDCSKLLQELELWCPGRPMRKTCHAPCGLWRVKDGGEASLDLLRGESVHAVCAIGHPEAFRATLESLGADVGSLQAYRDHADIPEEAFVRDGLVITTEKDAVRMGAAPDNVYALAIELKDV